MKYVAMLVVAALLIVFAGCAIDAIEHGWAIFAVVLLAMIIVETSVWAFWVVNVATRGLLERVFPNYKDTDEQNSKSLLSS